MTMDAAGPPAFDRAVLRAAMIASAGAAAIHFAAAHAHVMEYAPAGAFMLGAGFAQFAWIVWALEPSRATIRVAVAGNAAIVALWIVSRTVGMPFGPMPWVREHVHSPDAIATALEILIVVAGIALLRPSLLRRPFRLIAPAVAGCVLAVLATSHEPVRERAVVAATLLLAAAVCGLAAAYSHMPAVSRSFGRDRVKDPFARTRRTALDGGAWPSVGTGLS